MDDVARRHAWVREALTLELFSLLWMMAEGVGSVAAGLASRSLSLEVFGFDSLIEIIAALVVLGRMRLEASLGGSAESARVRAAERRAGAVVAACLVALAVYILAGTVHSLLSRTVPEPSVLGFVVTVSAVVVMPWLWARKRRLGESLGSEALQEDGAGNLACGGMALVTLLGLVAARVGWWWADPVASLVLGAFVLREGGEAWKKARGGQDA